jgi:predicted nucleic acid-binding protein
VRNAFELGVFRGLISRADVAAAWANLQNDLRKGRLVKVSIRWPPAFRQAARLSERHAATTGTRSLDILHVAAAKSVRALEFISFDGRQRTLATAAGLKVAP